MTPEPFTIAAPDAALADLQARLAAARLPSVLDPEGREDGAALPLVRRALDRWRSGYDWRAAEARLNRLPQFTAEVDGLHIHFVHRPGVGPAPLPLVLTHGWPGSFVEFERLVPLLADPGANGGDPADAFDVVAPSLPGYGFSAAPRRAGVNAEVIAAAWAKLMEGLGYRRFGAHGGDIGAGVSMWLARLVPERLAGVHVNYIPGSFAPPADAAHPPTPDEARFLEKARGFAAEEGAYAALHGTKPQTLAYSLSDSPLGLAAWMLEKFDSWSDHRGELEDAIPLDTILTNISTYWFSGALDASLRLYKENRRRPLVFGPGERVAPPLGVAAFPRELPTPPRSWVERVFDVRRWSVMAKGGHFAALEQPELLAADIQAFFRPLRP